jgi:hypothetical protein
VGSKILLIGDEEAELFYEFEGGEWHRYDAESGILITEAGDVGVKAKAVVNGIGSRFVETVYTVKAPVVRVEPAELLDFGEVEVGVRKSMAFLVYNDGEVTLLIEQLLFWDEGGEDVPEFRDIEDWSEPISVEPSEFFEFEINFEPTASGEISCEIRVESNATSGDRRLRASGIGYAVPQVAGPTFRPAPGEATFTGVVEVKLLSETEGATIRYTLDGSGPTDESPAYAGEPIRVAAAGEVVIKAQAFKDGWRSSAVSTAVYEASRPAWARGEVEGESGRIGSWVINIGADGTGTALGFVEDPAPTRVFGFEIELSDDGKILIGSDLISHASIGPETEPLAASVGDHPVAADEPEPQILGTLHGDGTITGAIPGFGNLVGAFGPVTGPSADLAGAYEMDLLYEDLGGCHVVIGPEGTVTMIMVTPDGVDGCEGKIDSSGHLVTMTSMDAELELQLDTGHRMALEYSPKGAEAPIEYMGLGAGETGVNRLVNLSTRGHVGIGAQNMIAGFVIRGTGKKPVLIRAMGPTLAESFNVTGALADPQIEVIPLGGTTVVASNDDWANEQDLLDAIASTGAFPAHAVGSKDAMLLTQLDPGSYTATISGVGETEGVSIVEVYAVDDLDTPEARQVNISTRGQIGTGDSVMIMGLVARGNAPRQFLIRAVGPTLEEFGLSGFLPDPVVSVVRGSDGVEVARNDDWDDGRIR